MSRLRFEFIKDNLHIRKNEDQVDGDKLFIWLTILEINFNNYLWIKKFVLTSRLYHSNGIWECETIRLNRTLSLKVREDKEMKKRDRGSREQWDQLEMQFQWLLSNGLKKKGVTLASSFLKCGMIDQANDVVDKTIER